jgi:hypothetical protein
MPLLRALSAALIAAALGACASEASARTPPWAISQRRVTAGVRAELPAPTSPSPTTGDPAAVLVERALHRRGLRFGTDGTVGALHEYVRWRHRFVPVTEARRGDVVFFRTTASETTCRAHAGLVEDVDGSGRVTFREARDGVVRQSHFHPTRPTERRDESGRVLNTFLRGKRVGDPGDALYYAGQMVCAVGRIVAKP